MGGGTGTAILIRFRLAKLQLAKDFSSLELTTDAGVRIWTKLWIRPNHQRCLQGPSSIEALAITSTMISHDRYPEYAGYLASEYLGPTIQMLEYHDSKGCSEILDKGANLPTNWQMSETGSCAPVASDYSDGLETQFINPIT